MPSRWTKIILWLPALLSSAAVVGCSTSSTEPPGATGTTAGATACPVAPGCPDGGAPSYQADILPIFQEACIPCHSPNGSAGFDETSYTEIHDQLSPILSQVNACMMPPLNGPPLSAAERVALTGWLKCGAPNN